MVGVLARKAVLVVDDDADNADLLVAILEQHGATVRKAADAPEAIRILALPWKPDVLLMDISMPGMDGYELLRTVRRVPTLLDVPAIAVTAHAFKRDVQRAADEGFAVHVSKPFDMNALVQIIVNLTA